MSYPLPKMSAMIANASKAVKGVAVRALKRDAIKADDKTIKSRLSFCQTCEYYRPEDSRCAHEKCGCYLRFKTWLHSQKCPAGKW